MEPDREASGRLGAAMDKRRLELRPPLKWNQVAERAGLSIAHLGRIRNGQARPSPVAAAQIEAALEWTPGTVAQIEAADPVHTPTLEPTAVLPPHLADIKDPTPTEAVMLQYIASMQEQIRQLTEKVDAIAADSDLDWSELENGTQERKGA